MLGMSNHSVVPVMPLFDFIAAFPSLAHAFRSLHFGGFSAAAAVLARGKVVGGPLFAPYAAGVRAERKRGGLAADAFSIWAVGGGL